MAHSLTAVRSKPLEVAAGVRVKNLDGMTIYYKSTPDVSSADTSVATGSSFVTAGPTWIVSAGTSRLFLDDIPTAAPTVPAANVAPATATTGTNTDFADGTLFVSSVPVHQPSRFTSASFLVGQTGGTDKVVAQVH